MTPFNSTPLIYIAYANASEAQSLMERIQDFSEPRLIDASDLSNSNFMQSIAQHQTCLLVLDEACAALKSLKSFGKEAAERHEFFRCLVVGDSNIEQWPQGTIQMNTHTLSTTIIDRLRNESNVLRMMSSRVRHVRRLQNR
jgi:hypothetical protein